MLVTKSEVGLFNMNHEGMDILFGHATYDAKQHSVMLFESGRYLGTLKGRNADLFTEQYVELEERKKSNERHIQDIKHFIEA